jgi:hypothetical protein
MKRENKPPSMPSLADAFNQLDARVTVSLWLIARLYRVLHEKNILTASEISELLDPKPLAGKTPGLPEFHQALFAKILGDIQAEVMGNPTEPR